MRRVFPEFANPAIPLTELSPISIYLTYSSSEPYGSHFDKWNLSSFTLHFSLQYETFLHTHTTVKTAIVPQPSHLPSIGTDGCLTHHGLYKD